MIPQIPDLVRLTVALDAVLAEPTQPDLFGDVTRGREFDRLCERVRRSGISDSVRDAWIAWVRERTPVADTVESDTGGGRR